MNFIGIIPARYQSERLPGKPLADIHGKPMVQWVYERSLQALDRIWVATDNEMIRQTVASFGGNAVMTAVEHRSGTDRCAEAARILSDSVDFDVVINIQGDEPFIRPEQIRLLMQCFTAEVQIATLARKITDPDELFDPNKPKVVVGRQSQALYFSRSVIPHARGVREAELLKAFGYLAHVGMYGYRSDVLQQITRLSPGNLEKAESLEQLRWLENGFTVKVAETEYQGFGIDTPQDLERALKLF